MWVEIFGMYYLYKLQDEDYTRTLRMNGSLFIQDSYLEEL